MHGLGNDFMVVDGIRQSPDVIAFLLREDTIRQLSNRNMGIGFDQLLLVQQPSEEAQSIADFQYRIFNADGSEVEQCGNGARCFVRFVHEEGLTTKSAITVETKRGLIYPRLEDNGMVTVDMGLPRFAPDMIPFIPTQESSAQNEPFVYPLSLQNSSGITELVQVSVVSMGNPHAVHILSPEELGNSDQIPDEIVVRQGPLIERHSSFPKRVNAGFMCILDRHSVRLRVYERGAGETLACGTGACAAVVAGIRRGLLDSPVLVQTRGGELSIAWGGLPASTVVMTGPAKTVFRGEVELPL